MDDLIEALTIMRRYDNPKYPTHCERRSVAGGGRGPEAAGRAGLHRDQRRRDAVLPVLQVRKLLSSVYVIRCSEEG